MNEKILAIKIINYKKPRNLFLGFWKLNLFNHENFLTKELNKFEFFDREEIENDPTYKQLIPYQILKCGDKYLSYNREKVESEKRLYNKYSIGIGGHINEQDNPNLENKEEIDIFNSQRIDNNISREFKEEMGIDIKNCLISTRILGLIDNEDDDVSKCHIGLVFLHEIRYCLFINSLLREKEFLPITELVKRYNQYENWSKIMIDFLKKEK